MQNDVRTIERLEPLQRDPHLVRPRKQTRNEITAAIIGRRFPSITGRGIDDHDRHAGEHAAGRVGHGAAQACRDARLSERVGGEQHHADGRQTRAERGQTTGECRHHNGRA